MKIRHLYFLITALLFLFACNGNDKNEGGYEYLGSESFTFTTEIDPTSLTQEESFHINSPITEIVANPGEYIIEDNDDLDTFNQTHARYQDEYISLNDLDTSTYFFIKVPGCPNFYDYADHSYNNGNLTITLDHFYEPDIACTANIYELYIVFKAGKIGSPLFISSLESRELDPDNTGDELNSFVADNNSFAFDLYHSISSESENMFFSPYSISVAMAMTWAGARNQTETQIADTLRFSFSQEKLHSLFNDLDLDLNNRNQGDPANDDKHLNLNISNEVWGQKDFSFLDTYLDTLMINYGAGIRLVDFMNNPEQGRLAINDWVAEQTENKIKDLLAQNDVTNQTRLVLTNTIYFNASWGIPFDPVHTYDGIFHLDDATTVTVPMMIPKEGSGENGEKYAAVSGTDYTAVQLPYYGDAFSMLIIVPDTGMFDNFELNLSSTAIDEIVNSLEIQEVDLRMPKFENESKLDLTETLSDMGIIDAFVPGTADFSGMDGRLDLFIGKVIHQAAITLDEAGTEASAATAVSMYITSIPDPLEIIIDRPFIYLIRDNQTGTILFLGRVKNPG